MTINASFRLTALALALAPLTAFAADRGVHLLPAGDGDLVAAQLSKARIAVPADIERAPVQFAWALDTSSALTAAKPFVQESREYWTDADSAQLAQGFRIHTTAEGAVVRLSPHAGNSSKAFDPLQVAVRKDGLTYARGEAFAASSNQAELKAAGAVFPEGTIAFTLKPELGAGDFELIMPKARGDFLVHVFEPHSGEVLSLTTDRNDVTSGGELKVFVDYASASAKSLGRVAGLITAPNGLTTDLRFAADAQGRWVATARPDAIAGAGQGLWEVHTFVTTSDGQVQRDAKTAFNAAPSTARLAGTARLADQKAARGGVQVSFDVDVATASRYNLSAVLYATDAKGQLVPAATAHSANWLTAGTQSLALTFGADLLGARGLSAPYEVRELTLSNQATLGVMERRDRGLRIER